MSYHEGKPNVLFTGNDVSKGLVFFCLFICVSASGLSKHSVYACFLLQIMWFGLFVLYDTI